MKLVYRRRRSKRSHCWNHRISELFQQICRIRFSGDSHGAKRLLEMAALVACSRATQVPRACFRVCWFVAASAGGFESCPETERGGANRDTD